MLMERSYDSCCRRGSAFWKRCWPSWGYGGFSKEDRLGGSKMEEAGGEGVQGKEVEAAVEARERQETLEVEGGNPSS